MTLPAGLVVGLAYYSSPIKQNNQALHAELRSALNQNSISTGRGPVNAVVHTF